MSIHRLLYRSEMNLAGTHVDIRHQVMEIVRSSEARNTADQLTGALLHMRGVFVQVLEGTLPAIESTFERICCDLRHRRVELLELVQAETRVFGEWSMVRITADRTIEKLFPSCLMTEDEQRPDSLSAQATIQLMRSLITCPPSDPGAATPASSG